MAKIRAHSTPVLWNYVPTKLNPADCASSGVKAEHLMESLWLVGSTVLPDTCVVNTEFPLVEPDSDKEVRCVPEVTVSATRVAKNMLDTSRSEWFSTLKSLINAVSCLRHIAKLFKGTCLCKSWHTCAERRSVLMSEQSLQVILQLV